MSPSVKTVARHRVPLADYNGFRGGLALKLKLKLALALALKPAPRSDSGLGVFRW